MVELSIAKDRIETLDLEGVKADLMKTFRYSRAKAETAVRMYRGFLAMVAEFPDTNLAPPRIVDEAWHMHILDTRRYFADCDAIFGGYLHHDPDAFGTHEFDHSWDFTRALYQQRMGVDLVARGEEVERQVTRSSATAEPATDPCARGGAAVLEPGSPPAPEKADLQAATCYVAEKADLQAATCYVAEKVAATSDAAHPQQSDRRLPELA